MSQTPLDFDPDVTQRNNPEYWAEVLLISERNADADRAALAREHLRKLNKRINEKSRPRPSAGNGHAAVCAAQRDRSTSRAGRVFSPPTCHARRGAGVNAAAGASAASAGRVFTTEKP